MTAPQGLGVVVLLLAATQAQAQSDRVDSLIAQRMNASKLPGLSLAVVKDGTVVKAAGYGVTDVKRQTRATPDTAYKIGSVSKQFIAAAVMSLVQAGLVGLDDPVGKYLDATPRSWQPMTLRQLLTHTGGLARESPGFDPLKVQPDADVLRAAYSLPLLFPPGEKWAYSNVGYFALAEIIRKVTGGPWPEYLRTRVVAPAGMSATAFTNDPSALGARTVGYTGNDNRRIAEYWPALRPSGALVSTVLDLARWDVVFNSDRLLSRASRELMTTPARLTNGTTAPYGFGLHVDTANGRRRVWHGGGLPGFAAHFVRFPEAELTIIMLANGDDVDLPAIAYGVADLYLEPVTKH